MRIYQLEIKHFRGIQYGKFNFTTPLVCLVGHGDTTKSTILDAIEYVLSPNLILIGTDPIFIESIACKIKPRVQQVAHPTKLTQSMIYKYVERP